MRLPVSAKAGAPSYLYRSEQVQAAIPKNTVLVEYVTEFSSHSLGKSKSEFRYGAVVLSADAPPRWLTLDNARDIEASLKRYQILVR